MATIATTIAHHFDDLKRQGAYLSFERATSNPSAMIRTLAHELALFDTELSSLIEQCLRTDKKIAEKPLRSQFETLLQVPLRTAAKKLTGPIIIVLDALDECGDPSTRQDLLEILSTKLPTLPSIFRWLITSRPEEDIRFRFTSSNLVMSLESMVDQGEAISDIEIFISAEMKRLQVMKSLPLDWPKREQIQSLAQGSEGLFIWASTACRLVAQASSPMVQLGTLLSSVKGKGIVGLDALYTTALRTSCSWPKDDVVSWDHFKSVMTVVLFSRENMDDTAIDQLLGLTVENPSHLIFSSLSSLFNYIPTQPIRPLHASFRDYLIDEKRSNGEPWSLASLDPEHTMAEHCLRVMSAQLRFNICNIPTSYSAGFNYHLTQRSKDSISPLLKYSGTFWVNHLAAIKSMQSTMIDAVRDFSNHRFLFWVEVISIYDRLGVDAKALKVPKLMNVCQFNHDL